MLAALLQKMFRLGPDPSQLVDSAAIGGLVAEAGLAVNVVVKWGEALPFPDNHFDLVRCRAVLQHAKDLSALFRGIGRALIPGGRLVATREHAIGQPSDLERFFELHPLHRLYDGEYSYLLCAYLGAIRGGDLELIKVLNPYESDINLFPQPLADIKIRIAEKLHCPVYFVPTWLVHFVGGRIHFPGRLYSFIAMKAE